MYILPVIFPYTMSYYFVFRLWHYFVLYCSPGFRSLHGPSLSRRHRETQSHRGLIGAAPGCWRPAPAGPTGPGPSESDPESSPVRESGSPAAAPGPGPGQGPGPASPEVVPRQLQGPGQCVTTCVQASAAQSPGPLRLVENNPLHFGSSDASLAACRRGPSAVERGRVPVFVVHNTTDNHFNFKTTAETLERNESSNPRNVAATAACLPE
jgi:hypothetical protein